MKLRKSLVPILSLVAALSFAGCSTNQSSTNNSHNPSVADHEHDHEHDHGHGSEGGKETTEASPRLVLSSEKGITVLDENLEKIANYDLPGKTYLAKAADNRHVIAADRDRGQVYTIDSGTWSVSHGDHFHWYVSDPKKSEEIYQGEKPTHMLANASATAVFFDGTGQSLIIPNEHLGHEQDEQITLKANGPMHGVAAPLPDGKVLITQPSTKPEAKLPDSVSLMDSAGKELKNFECLGAHGIAPFGSKAVIGCQDSALFFDKEDVVKVANPNAEGRISAPKYNSTGTAVLSNYSATSVVLAKDNKLTLIDIGAEYGTISATSDGKFVVLDTAGKIHLINDSGQEEKTISVTEPWTRPKGHGGSAPTVVGGDFKGTPTAWVLNPQLNKVYQVNLTTDEIKSADVADNPSQIVVTNA